MRMIATIAAAVALGLGATAALADDDSSGFISQSDATFDLGIDVTTLPQTSAGVNQYLGSLAPETRSVLMSTCEHYIQNPGTVQAQRTLQFCSDAVNG